MSISRYNHYVTPEDSQYPPVAILFLNLSALSRPHSLSKPGSVVGGSSEGKFGCVYAKLTRLANKSLSRVVK